MDWEKKQIPQDVVKTVSTKYNCNLITASILVRRGITEGSRLLYYLEDGKRYLHNPYFLPGMEDAVQRITAAKEEGESVIVFGDRDTDGITGTALLVSYLQSIGVRVSWRIPSNTENYGLSAAAVEEAAKDGVSLIITVDCGIANVAEVKMANEAGIDVIVTDHHNPQEELPDAVAIVNPKLADADIDYPWKDISGCAVVYKFVSAICFSLNSPDYGVPVSLLNVSPSNGAFVVDAAKMRNGVILKTIQETIVPGKIGIMDTRLASFLQGESIFVWDAPSQKKMLKDAFGGNVDFNLFDIAPLVGKEFPALNGKSLLRLREGSSFAHYSEKPLSELDVFCNIYITYILSRDKIFESDDKFLQFAALGTVADILPLENENRIIVKIGLSTMTARPQPALAALVQKLGIQGHPLTERDIAWRVIPSINSAERMAQSEAALKLLLSEDAAERDKLAADIVKMNDDRKARGDAIWAVLQPSAEKNMERFNGVFAVATGSETEIPKPFTGLMANRLLTRYKLPSIAISVGETSATGSIRMSSSGNFSAFSLLDDNKDLLEPPLGMWGGHKYAAGFTMSKKNLEIFLSRLERFDENEGGAAEEEKITVDAEIPLQYLTLDIFNTVDTLSPYGTGFPHLVFLARGLIARDVHFMGQDASHVRLTLDAGSAKWPAVYWQAAEKVGRDRDFFEGDKVDAVFHITRDYYGGREKPQLIILDMKRSPLAGL